LYLDGNRTELDAPLIDRSSLVIALMVDYIPAYTSGFTPIAGMLYDVEYER